MDKITLPETTDAAMIHIECELAPPFHIIANVATTGDLNGNFTPYFPEDAELRLYSQIDEEFVFKYNADKKYYEVLNGRIKSGLDYTISAKLKDTSVHYVFASTKIPRIINVDSMGIASSEEIFNTDGSKDIYTTIKVYTPEIITEGIYYRMTLNYRLHNKVIDNGVGRYVYDPELRATGIYSIDVGGAAIHPLYHMDGVLVDPSRLEENYFTVTIKSVEPISENELTVSSVHTKLYTLSESYYRYQLAKSKQLKLGNNNMIEPVVDYTNIENGLGFFGSYIMKGDSIVVR